MRVWIVLAGQAYGEENTEILCVLPGATSLAEVEAVVTSMKNEPHHRLCWIGAELWDVGGHVGKHVLRAGDLVED